MPTNSCSPGAVKGARLRAAKRTLNGEDAHIVAAAQGGPRFDPNLTSEQRSNLINGIWLCQNCAHKIDADENRYSVALLYHWKLQAEHAAHQNVGKPSITTVAMPPGNRIPEETIRVVQDKNESQVE